MIELKYSIMQWQVPQWNYPALAVWLWKIMILFVSEWEEAYYDISFASAALAHYRPLKRSLWLSPTQWLLTGGFETTHTEALSLSLFSCHGGKKCWWLCRELKWGNGSISAEWEAYQEIEGSWGAKRGQCQEFSCSSFLFLSKSTGNQSINTCFLLPASKSLEQIFSGVPFFIPAA